MVEIVLEGPAKNALSTTLMTAVREQLEAAGDAPVLLRGSGDAFSAGLDLKEVGSLDADEMEDFLRLLEGTVDAVFRHPAPTVAAVNGHAIAGGCILALMCDHRVATADPRARIGLNEVALGLRFPPRVLQMVRYRVPPSTQERVLMGAGLHDPETAYGLGLVDEVVAADELLPRCQAVLERLAALPRGAYADTKADLRGEVGQIAADAEARFVQDVLPVWAGEELRQRIRAFLTRKG
jgi:enoyl-CoA hydratase/carnithine racemase